MRGIYIITNLITRDCYVGSSVNIAVRLKEHQRELRLGKWMSLKTSHFQNAWDRYGEEKFVFETLEILPEFATIIDLLDVEQEWLTFLWPTGYNQNREVHRPPGLPKGWVHSEGAKLRLSQYRSGKTYEELYGEESARRTREKLKWSDEGRLEASKRMRENNPKQGRSPKKLEHRSGTPFK